jgi:hypothetical protein
MIRDRGSNFTDAFDAVLADAGIRTVLCNIQTPRVIRRNTNRRHIIGDHHGWTAERATLLLRAVDDNLGTHSTGRAALPRGHGRVVITLGAGEDVECVYRFKTNRMVSDLGFIGSAMPAGSTR